MMKSQKKINERKNPPCNKHTCIGKNTELPSLCPTCGSYLYVKELNCLNCNTKIYGSFEFPPFLLISAESQKFIQNFILNRGSLKKMCSSLNLSYPTVRHKLDDIQKEMKNLEYKKL